MKKINVAFLWHMHQPMYKDLRTGKYMLPWVRLHSTYSYLDMASILDHFPGVRVTFNITPCLIRQLLDIAEDPSAEDLFHSLSVRDASMLSEKDRVFMLKNFFSCDLEKAIFPIKRYAELFFRRGEDLRESHLLKISKDFSEADLRDLQVFFNLAWCGFTLRDENKVVKELLVKGGGYTEDEKLALLKVQERVVCSIIPKYRELVERDQIEISTSPYYHPILPLICGSEGVRSYDLTEDARVQVRRGAELYERVFGRRPVGMWPSEGSVSQEMIPVVADEGFKWIATDEGIVIESFRVEDRKREDLIYRAFSVEQDGRRLDILFRDINLSNAISFRYSSMPARKAAEDLVKDINGIASAMSHRPGDHVVPVILDGENPWPYYPDGGKEFLGSVYDRLSKDKKVELVTVGSFLSGCGERERIPRLYAGSWINRNFDKWTGSPQKNKAWEYLEKARRELMASSRKNDEAIEELYIAEGSDWFWWYDDFGTEVNFIFDDLFRLHLRNIYDLIGRKSPHYLDEPIYTGPTARKLSVTAGPGEMAYSPRVLFVSPEVVPFAKTGGLADVAGSLPAALASLGCDVRVMMPLYKCVPGSGLELKKELTHVKYPFRHSVFGFDVYSHRSSGITTYFIAKDKYFHRDGLYGGAGGDFSDNGYRFSFFSKAALGAARELGFKADIIHCNDWQTALVPFYMKFHLSGEDIFSAARTIFTIHNMSYQGVFSRSIMGRIGIPEELFNMDALEFYGKINFMKAGILYSDAISTVSHKYAGEIMTPEYGCGLDGLLRKRKEDLFGIPNGVDYSVWSPRNDKYIKRRYGPDSLEGKAECREDLMRRTGLETDPSMPVLGCVTRLVYQKGMDLVAGAMDSIMSTGAGMVILGSGSANYNRLFSDLARKYRGRLFVSNEFDEELAHKIEAGSDIFLMPSRYEPCGLNQMYSIKYGTIPVVRATGGLDDVIVDHDEDRDNGNGFKFGPPTEDALFEALERAIQLFGDREAWKRLVKRAMEYDHSWDHSAKQYLELYRMMSRGE